ncbi:unnamed protein product, partial [Symbiodinium necroappetens]
TWLGAQAWKIDRGSNVGSEAIRLGYMYGQELRSKEGQWFTLLKVLRDRLEGRSNRPIRKATTLFTTARALAEHMSQFRCLAKALIQGMKPDLVEQASFLAPLHYDEHVQSNPVEQCYVGRYGKLDLPLQVQTQLQKWSGLDVHTVVTSRGLKCFVNPPVGVVSTRRTTLVRSGGVWYFVEYNREIGLSKKKFRLPLNANLVVSFFGDVPTPSQPYIPAESQPQERPIPGAPPSFADARKVHECLNSIDTLDLTLIRDGVQHRVFLLTAIDTATSFARVFYLSSGDAAAAVQSLKRGWIDSYGAPEYIYADPDTIFRSETFAAFLTRHAIVERLSAAQAPFQHGQIERLHRTIRQQAQRVFESEPSCSAYEAAVEVVQARNELMRVEGVSPAVLVFGKLPKAPPTFAEGDEDFRLLAERLQGSDPLYEVMMLRRVAARTAWVQSEVRDRRHGVWLGPGEVIAVESTNDRLAEWVMQKLQEEKAMFRAAKAAEWSQWVGKGTISHQRLQGSRFRFEEAMSKLVARLPFGERKYADMEVLAGQEVRAVLADYSSCKIDRAVWSSYASELQAATISTDASINLMLLYEQVFYGLKARQVKEKLTKGSAVRALVTDNNGLYDSIQTEKPSTRQGVKMQSLVHQILYDLVVDYGFQTFWVNGSHMLADGLTKLSSSGAQVDAIRTVLEDSLIRITYCEVSGRKEQHEVRRLRPVEPANKELESSIDV